MCLAFCCTICPNFADLDTPTFNTSSQSNISVEEGRYFSVVCNARSNPKISRYIWMSYSPSTFLRSDTLVYESITRQQAGTYICVAQVSQHTLEKRSSLVINVECKFAFLSICSIYMLFFRVNQLDCGS